MNIDVTTRIFEHGLVVTDIEQVTFPGSSNELREKIMTRILNTQEAQVREALVALGWTPPGERSAHGGVCALDRVTKATY